MLSRTAVRHSAARPLFSAQSSLRASGFRQLPQIASRTGRRYASGGHEVKKTSDLPWLAVALVITIPSTYFALQPRSAPHSGDHGHGSHDEHSTESHEVKSEDEGKEEKSDDGETEEKSEDTDEKSDDKDENKDAGDDEGQKDADAKDSAAGSEKSGESKKSEGGKK